VLLGLRVDAPVLAILPGSRESEVRHLSQVFFQAAALVQQALPAIQCIVPAVPLLRDRILAAAAACGLQDRVTVVAGQSHAVLAACDVTLIASGTATLEAALFKRPMVIAYRMGALSWQIMRRKRLQPWVGLPNILSGEFVVPELLQDDATPQALAREVLAWLDAPAVKIAQLERRFTALHRELLRDTPKLAAHAIAQVIEP